MSNSDFIATCALFVAIASVLIASGQLCIQRNHNRKSLRPIGYIDLGDFENNLYAKISNYGLGPLIIIKVEFNKEKEILNNLLDFLPSDFVYNDFVKEFENKIITTNNSLCIFDASFKEEEYDLRDKFRGFLKDIHVNIHYKSVYDEKGICERKLNWFGRNLN